MSFFFRQLQYNLRTSLLVQPAILLLLHLVAGLWLPHLEAQLQAQSPMFASWSAWLGMEPGSAQVVLSTLAGGVMTVVSVVYSILLVALSLASMQFSTRILGNFMRDELNRTVLGMFVGSFAYSLLLLRSIHLDPPFVPGFCVVLAVGLALICLASLLLFIQHIAESIQVNVIVDRIAQETETVIESVFPAQPPSEAQPWPSLPHAVLSQQSGYLQLVDVPGLLELPGKIALARPMGSFLSKGAVLFHTEQPLSPVQQEQLQQRVDIGNIRTMQDDAEFGFRQIVDIALKALSPAVNDPSTGATCVDHLGRLLIVAARRSPPQTVYEGRIFVPNTSLLDLLDLSFEQIRQYSRSDMATGLRILRALVELDGHVREPAVKDRIRVHARLILQAAEAGFASEDCEELRRRYRLLG